MRIVWAALLCLCSALFCLCGALGAGNRASAAAGTLALHECRLEHPLRLNSLAARCGTLAVAEDPAAPGAGSIDLAVAVVPALNRRSTAPPLFLLAGGPGQARLRSVHELRRRIRPRQSQPRHRAGRSTGHRALGAAELRVSRRLASGFRRPAPAARGGPRLSREARRPRSTLHHQHRRRGSRAGAHRLGLRGHRSVRVVLRHPGGAAVHAAASRRRRARPCSTA